MAFSREEEMEGKEMLGECHFLVRRLADLFVVVFKYVQV